MSRFTFFARQDRKGRWCRTSSTAKKTRNVSELKTTLEFLALVIRIRRASILLAPRNNAPGRAHEQAHDARSGGRNRAAHRRLCKARRETEGRSRSGSAGRGPCRRGIGHPQQVGGVDELRERPRRRIDRKELLARRGHDLRRARQAG